MLFLRTHCVCFILICGQDSTAQLMYPNRNYNFAQNYVMNVFRNIVLSHAPSKIPGKIFFMHLSGEFIQFQITTSFSIFRCKKLTRMILWLIAVLINLNYLLNRIHRCVRLNLLCEKQEVPCYSPPPPESLGLDYFTVELFEFSTYFRCRIQKSNGSTPL